MISLNPFTKIVKYMVPGAGVKALRRGQSGHIVKLYLFNMFCTITVVEDKVTHCFYIHNVLLLNDEIRVPQVMGQKLRREEDKYDHILNSVFLFMVIVVCHPLKILTLS